MSFGCQGRETPGQVASPLRKVSCDRKNEAGHGTGYSNLLWESLSSAFCSDLALQVVKLHHIHLDAFSESKSRSLHHC